MTVRCLRMGLLSAACIGALVSQVQAAVVFDEYTPGVTWDVDWGSVNTTNVYSGAQSIQAWSGNGQIVFVPPQVEGVRTPVAIGSAPILDFYVNTVTAAPISVTIKINTPSRLVEYEWNGGGTYDVDGVTQTDALTTDGNISTWQHVKFDVTQPFDFWGANGAEFTSLTSADTITKITISGSANTLVDAAQLTAVPEPTSIALLGLAGLAALRRRRSA